MNRLTILLTLHLCILATCLGLHSCSDSLPTPPEMLPGNTVIVYMGAENSLAPFAQKDIEEMKAAMGDIPNDCQVVIYKDAELKPAIFHLTNKKFSTWREYKEEHISADMSTMKSILRDIVKGFPSAKYSLILWSHGTGWSDAESTKQKSIIIDNGQNNGSNRGSWIHMSQLAEVMEALPHLEYIFFDACYMQSVEVASYLYKYANYLIASPTEIPGEGAPYHLIMKSLCTANAQEIIEGYASGYTGTGYGVLLSALKTANFMDFCAATSACIPRAFQKAKMPQLDNIQIYAPAYSASYPYQTTMPVPYDIRSALFHSLDDADYQTWEEIWDETIPYRTQAERWSSVYTSFDYGNRHSTMQDPSHYGGISINIPQEEYSKQGWDNQFRLSPWYSLTLWEETGW